MMLKQPDIVIIIYPIIHPSILKINSIRSIKSIVLCFIIFMFMLQKLCILHEMNNRNM